MKTKIFYATMIGLCLMLTGMKSSAQFNCNTTITVDAWTLYIQDNGTHTYTCSGQVRNSTGFCPSDIHDYGSVSQGPNSMAQYAYRYNYNYNGCTYWLHVVVTRDDGATRSVDSSGQLPDINYHISPGTLRVTFL
jgi:hypothetical protein